MSDSPASAKPNGKKKLVLWLVVCLAGIGGGATMPMMMGSQSAEKKAKTESTAKKKHDDSKAVAIPFGDVVVNLSEERMTRYLRLKIILKMDGEEEKAKEHVNKHKPAMKSWLISHLAGKSLKDVGGTVGVKRLQREIHEKFEEMLFHDPSEGHLYDVLFEEYVVQ